MREDQNVFQAEKKSRGTDDLGVTRVAVALIGIHIQRISVPVRRRRLTRFPERMNSEFAMKIIRVMSRIYDTIERGMTLASSIFLLYLLFILPVHVTGRYIFNKPIRGVEDTVDFVMPLIVFLGLAYVQALDRHIKMELLSERLPDNMRNILEIVILSLFLFISLVVAWYSWQYALTGLRQGEFTLDIHLPLGPPRMAVSVGFILLSIRLAMQIVQRVKAVFYHST
ncbi:TRAP transporter small permease [Chloroflexota bacterium]